MRSQARVLVVEDDPRIGSWVHVALRAAGYDVTWTVTGAAAMEAAAHQPIDVVLLDLGLPDVDGLDVCRVLRRERPDAVIVILTARGEDIDVIAGLESGADDYVTKPFGMTVLLARIEAHLRRALPWEMDGVLRVGDLVIDPGARRCTLAGHEVHLRPKLFDLLGCLAREAGHPVSRVELMAKVWDKNWVGSTKTLDVHIYSLRQRLSEAAQLAGEATPRIRTVPGVGYQLDAMTSWS
jgi:DNA-binding response OmpR family regulator